MSAEHDKVEVPAPPVIEVDNRLHDRLVEVVSTVRSTVSVNPLTDPTVIVESPSTPVAREML